MKITRIEIVNFRSIDHVIFDAISGGLMLLGPNGAGKSSVIEAVRYALWGHATWTTADGRGGGPLVRDGEKEATVLVDTDLGRIVFTVTSAGKRTWALVDADGQVLADDPSAFWKLAGVDARHAEISANLGHSIESGNFADVLGVYLAGTITTGAVLGAASEHATWLENFLKKSVQPRTVQEWRNVGETAYKARTGLNGELKQVKADIETYGFLALPQDRQKRDIPVSRLGDVQKQQATLAAKRDTLNRELGAATATPPAVDLPRIQGQIDAMEVERQAAASKAEDAKEKRDGVGLEVAAARERVSEMVGQATVLQDDIRRLKSNCDTMHGGICPTCNQSIPPTLIDAAETDITEAQARLAAIHAERQNLSTTTDDLAQREKQYTATYMTQQAVADRLARELAGLRTQIDVPAATAGRTAAEIQADLDTVTASLARGQEILDVLTKIQNRDGQQQRQAELEALIAHHTWAVEAFRDGALLNQLTSGNKRTELVERCNAQLAGTHVMDIVLNGKTVDILFDHRKLSLCSTGEQRIAQWAFANAYAADTQPVILDDINDLDDAHKNLVHQRLQKGAGGIYAATKDAPPDETTLEKMQAAFTPARVVWMKK